MGFLSDEAARLAPYTPGEQPQDAQYIMLNTNECPFPPSPKVVKALSRAEVLKLNLYSDPTCGVLTDAIAARYGLRRENILAANGSDEVLAFAFRAFCGAGQGVAYPDITYGFYRAQTALFGLEAAIIPLREDFTLAVEDYLDSHGTVIIATPTAPSGIAVPRTDIQRLVEADPDRVVIVDEAYVDFGARSAVELIDSYPNLVVVQTMSKSRSLAGLRVGFALGSEDLIAALRCVKNSFNSYTLDRLALAGAEGALRDRDYLRATAMKIQNTRECTASQLKKMGFVVTDSSANFLFVSHPDMPAKALLDGLRERGILVRWWDKPRIRDYLRITVGTDEEMQALCAALAALLGGM